MVKRLSAMLETQVRSLCREDPLERKWQPTPVHLPGKSHGQRSLAGYSPWGCKESDMIEVTAHMHAHMYDTYVELCTQKRIHILSEHKQNLSKTGHRGSFNKSKDWYQTIFILQ